MYGYDYLNIGCVPHGEDCVGINHPHERAECQAFLKQIERHYPAPFGARLRVKAFDHDFGTYHEVCAFYDTNNDEAEKWAFAVEADAKKVLEFWDEEFRPNFKEESNA